MNNIIYSKITDLEMMEAADALIIFSNNYEKVLLLRHIEKRIWENITGINTFKDIVHIMCEEFKFDKNNTEIYNIISADIREFLVTLEEKT